MPAQADPTFFALTALAAAALSAALTPLVRALAIRHDVLDHPATDIKTHKGAIPHLGGVAVFAAFAGVLLALRFFTSFPTGTLRSLRGVLTGATLVFLLGLVDDFKKPHGLGFKTKFLFQIVAALLIIQFDMRIHFIKPDFLAYAVTVLWVVGITNALNIIDIMDGLSASQAVVGALAFLVIALPSKEMYVDFTAAALAGAALGFLPYNLSKRYKIFLGDAGALTVGFVLAALSLGTRYSRVNPLGVYAPLLILGIPIYDTLFVMVLRFLKGKSPFMGSKDHFALRMEVMGLTRPQILSFTILASLLLALCAFVVTQVSLGWAAAIYAIVGAEILMLSVRLARVVMH